MHLNLPMGAKVVKHYPYRTARCWNRVVEISAWEAGHDEMRQFHDRLADMAGVRADNHELYAIQCDDGPTVFYYWFSDWKLYIGLTLDEKGW